MAMDARSLIALRIREMNITQNEAERRCELPRGNLSRILAHGAGVSIETAIRIRDVLGVPVEAWALTDERAAS